MKKADAILCGDLHIREDTPVCRKDNFLQAQWKKLNFISELQTKHNCPVLCSGDLFHKALPSLWLLSKTMLYLPEQFYTVYGNHDLPSHNLKEDQRCGVYALNIAQSLGILQGTHFGQEPVKPSFRIKGKKVCVWHIMTYKQELPFPGCTDLKARSLLHKYPQFDLILTGDNHKPFTQEYKGRLLVNPGSMMRQTADQIDYEPAILLWYAEENIVQPVYLPIEKGVVTREYIEKNEQRENRIIAFVETLNKKGLDAVNFEKNLEMFFQQNNIHKNIKELIYKLIEKE